MSNRLVKSTSDKKIAGVCGGLAQYTNIDVTFIRIGFVLAAIFGFGSPILIYVVLALVMPKQ